MVRLNVLLVILLILGICGIGFAADKAPVFKYDFSKPDSITQGTVNDESGNGHKGLIVGDVHIVDAEHGKVALFDGTSGYIKIPSLSSWDMKRSVTISSVVKFMDDGKSWGQNEAHDMIITKDNYFILGNHPAGPGGQRLFYFNTYDGKTWNQGSTTFQNVYPNTWMQLDVRMTLVDKSLSKYTVEFYINGVKITETQFVNRFNNSNNIPIYIGYGFGDNCWLMHGHMATISMYNRALTEREIIESVRNNPYVDKKPEMKLMTSLDLSPKKGIGIINVNGSNIGDMTKAKCTYLVEMLGDNSSRQFIQKGSFPSFTNDISSAKLNISKLSPGKYDIKITCNTADKGTFIGNISLEKPDINIWRNAQAGVSDKVIPPWTPLVVNNKRNLQVSCWGRQYSFDGSGFVKDVLTRDEHILSKPLELSAVVNGETVKWKSKTTSIKSSSPAKLVFKGGAESKGLKMSVDSYMEFDGLVVSKVTITADKSAKVGQCSLKIPIRLDNAKYMSYLFPEWGSYRGKVANAPKSFAFPYYMWIGDEDRGFCWFSERNMSGLLSNPKKAVEIQTGNDDVVIKINILDKAISLEKPLIFTVGYQATPMRPLPEKWRTKVHNDIQLVWTWKDTPKYFGYAEPAHPDAYRAQVKQAQDAGKMFIPYILLQAVSGSTVEQKYFGSEWWSGVIDRTSADIISFDPPSPVYTMCPAAHDWVDTVTYRIKKFVEEYKINGLYHDFSSLYFCRNTEHGCPKEGGYPILAARELYRRSHTILSEQPQKTFEIAHTGWTLSYAPVSSFQDAVLSGEEITLVRGKGNYYKSFWTTDTNIKPSADGFLADYMGRQFGTIPIFFRAPESDPEYKKPHYEQQMLSILLLHDVVNAWGYWQDGYGRMWKVLDAFGIGDAEFIPYWKAQSPVTVTSFDPKPAEYALSAPVLVSVYNRPGNKALVVVGNTSEVKIHATVNIDSKALGFTKPIRVRDAYNPDADLLKGSSVEVDIPELEYRLLLVDEMK